MAEYIERESVLDKLLQYGIGWGAARVKGVINSIPAADVQPVVRCCECKYGTRLVTDFAGNEYIECCHGNVSHRLDWFCADGAKEETE